jgi:hypothetical protein
MPAVPGTSRSPELNVDPSHRRRINYTTALAPEENTHDVGTRYFEIQIAESQRALLTAFFFMLLVQVVARSLTGPMFNAIMTLAQAFVVLNMAYRTFRLCDQLGERVILWTPLSLVPFVNYFALYFLNQKATKYLRSKGYRVGFMGVANIEHGDT